MGASNNKRAKQAYYWTLLAIVFVGVILVNIISSYVYKRIDMTDDQRYSLAESTQKFLESSNKKFKGRVYIEIYLDGALPAELERFRNSIEDKLKEFKAIAGDRIEYKFTDPKAGNKKDSEELEYQLWQDGKGILPMNVMYTKDGHESQMRLWPGAILEYGGATGSKRIQVQLLPGTKTGQPFVLEEIGSLIENATKNLEYNLMNGLRRVTREKTPNIGFLQGHGELGFGATYMARSILAQDYNVSDVEIKDSLHALDGYDGLIIARPTKRFTEKELYLIDQFVMRGGRLMCFMDPLDINIDTLNVYKQCPTTRIETGLATLLFDYGINIQDKYMLDALCTVKAVSSESNARIPWFYHVLATPTSHPISRNVEPVSMPYTSPLSIRDKMKGVVVSPILKSSMNSFMTGSAPLVTFAIPLNYLEQGQKIPQLAIDPKDPRNEKCLAAVAQGNFISAYKNRLPPEFKEAKILQYKEKSTREGKVFVAGNGRMISNKYDSILDPTGRQYMFRPLPGPDGKHFNDLMFDRELASIRFGHIFGNQDFLQNLVDFMMDENSVLDIRSREIEIHRLNKDKILLDASFYKSVNVLLPIVIIVLLAIVMFFLRRRKYAK